MSQDSQDGWSTQAKLMWSFTADFVAEALKDVDLPCSPCRVVDVACGTGTSSVPLALKAKESGQEIHISATDISQGMLDTMMVKVRSLHLEESIKPQVMDALALEFDDNTFDLGMSMFGLFLTPDPSKATKELVRVLKPGSMIVSTWWKRNAVGDFLRSLLQSLGKDDSMLAPMDSMLGKFDTEDKLQAFFADMGVEDVRVKEVRLPFPSHLVIQHPETILANPVIKPFVADISVSVVSEMLAQAVQSDPDKFGTGECLVVYATVK